MTRSARFVLATGHLWVRCALKLAELDDDQMLYEPLVEIEKILASIRSQRA